MSLTFLGKPILRPEDFDLLAVDFRSLTGCDQKGVNFWWSADGYLIVLCNHEWHPLINGTKRMAS